MRTLSTIPIGDPQFPAAEALIDRGQISVEARFQCPSREAFEEAVMLWGDRTENDDPHTAPWLTATRDHNPNAYRLNVRGPWLFGGHGTTRFSDQSLRGSFHLDIKINPTRWLAHMRAFTPDALAALPAAAALRRPIQHSILATLDGNNNVLDRDRLGGMAFDGRAARRDRLLAIYLQAIQNFIVSRIWPHSPDNQHSVVPSELFTNFSRFEFRALQQAEVYWETTCHDALTTVHSLRNAARALSSNVEETYAVGSGQVRDAAWVAFPLTADMRMKIYAKTDTRIRFEVVYQGPHIRQTAGRARHTDRAGIQDVLIALCHDASGRVERAWQRLSRMLTSNQQAGDLLDFVECLRRANLGLDARSLLSILANNRAIMADSASPEVIRGLIAVGIIQRPQPLRHGGGSRYPLAQRWSLMFDQLLQRQDCPAWSLG